MLKNVRRISLGATKVAKEQQTSESDWLLYLFCHNMNERSSHFCYYYIARASFVRTFRKSSGLFFAPFWKFCLTKGDGGQKKITLFFPPGSCEKGNIKLSRHKKGRDSSREQRLLLLPSPPPRLSGNLNAPLPPPHTPPPSTTHNRAGVPSSPDG